MAQLCQEQIERARKNERIILMTLASAGQRPIADVLGIDESTVTRMKEGQIERMSQMLAVLGLKVVPVDVKCFDPATVGMLLELARARLNNIDRADKLAWD